MNEYQIVLPLPPSVNAMHGYAKGGKTVYRSKEYTSWLNYAGLVYRLQYPGGLENLMTGRLRAQYIFIFVTKKGDTFNREKCLSDFLEKKFYKNDSQIDEGQVFRRKSDHGQDRVRVWLTEIDDNRYLDTENDTDSQFLP